MDAVRDAKISKHHFRSFPKTNQRSVVFEVAQVAQSARKKSGIMCDAHAVEHRATR